jgi:hypothetical protein
MVPGTVRQVAGPRERGSKELKTELAQGGPLGSSPLKSDDSSDVQEGGWTMLKVAKDTQQKNWKTTPGSQRI